MTNQAGTPLDIRQMTDDFQGFVDIVCEGNGRLKDAF